MSFEYAMKNTLRVAVGNAQGVFSSDDIYLVLKFFGEEDAQCFFVNCFTEAVADEEAQQ